jgi:hypothetical protein
MGITYTWIFNFSFYSFYIYPSIYLSIFDLVNTESLIDRFWELGCALAVYDSKAERASPHSQHSQYGTLDLCLGRAAPSHRGDLPGWDV